MSLLFDWNYYPVHSRDEITGGLGWEEEVSLSGQKDKSLARSTCSADDEKWSGLRQILKAESRGLAMAGIRYKKNTSMILGSGLCNKNEDICQDKGDGKGDSLPKKSRCHTDQVW